MNQKFFRRITPESAYVLGFFAADGNLNKNARGSWYLSFQSADKVLIHYIKRVMGAEQQVSERSDPRTQGKFYRLQIGSLVMAKDLIKIGFSQSKTRHLPTGLLDHKFCCHFLRGYFDGDGNVWVGKIHTERKTPGTQVLIAFTSCSSNFLIELQRHLHNRLGTNGSIITTEGKYSRLQYSKRDAFQIYNFMYNADHPIFSLRRKQERMEQVFGKIKCGSSSIG